MIDIAAIDRATDQLLQTGRRTMNAFLLAEDEQSHAMVLLQAMDPAPGARVVDAGCGIGEVAGHMRAARPDLQFELVNLSQAQLNLCPPGMARHLCSFDSMPFDDDSVDVVMFNFALCHSENWSATLKEARRVLKDGGTLFIFDMNRLSGSNDLMRKVLHAAAYPASDIVDAAYIAGFDAVEARGYEPVSEPLRDLMPGSYDLVVGDVAPVTLSLVKRVIADEIASAFHRHRRIGFQFSGGRDSTAALFLLRPYWDRMTVYHLDTGDQFPETRFVVSQVEAAMGRPVTRIVSSVDAVRRTLGLASDLVPVDNTAVGRMVSGRETKIIGRYDCCRASLMEPMHQRILDDGITLIIRGQRDDEYAAPPKRSGDTDGALEVLYPIQSWTGDQVSAFLESNGLPQAAFYSSGMKRAPECMGCTAWWDEGRAQYLQRFHPEHFEVYKSRMKTIRIEIDRQYQMLED